MCVKLFEDSWPPAIYNTEFFAFLPKTLFNALNGGGKINCQTPVLGLGLGVDFTLANNKNKNKNKNNNPHPYFPGWDGTRGLKFGTQT